MIEFRPSKVDKKNNNTPILKDAEIDELAEAVLRDYKPHLLKEPRKIKYEHFLESYLGANLRYNHIYYEKEENRTFGATAFNLEKLKIFDKENLKLDEITLQRGSVVIDLYVTEEGREGLELFTGLHEGGHLWLHQGVYTRNDSQVSLFDIDPQLDTNNELPSVTCCRRKDIEIFGDRYRKRTAYQWREHQADYFASAICFW